MKVLMFGWEFPPHISGGLGTACYGLTKGMLQHELEIIFVVPKVYGDEESSKINLLSAEQVPISIKKSDLKYFKENFEYIEMESALVPYLDPVEYERRMAYESTSTALDSVFTTNQRLSFSGKYGYDLLDEVSKYALIGASLGEKKDFDIIHSHDWLTYPAGIAAKRVSGKPLVIHVHATEYDRSGENVNPAIFSIEKMGMEAADVVICVSNLTKNIVIKKYGISPEKIYTVHNAVDFSGMKDKEQIGKAVPEKIVTFLGRITFQKGPEYFIEAANKVLKKDKNVRFVMAGSGDMMHRMIRRVAELNISSHFHFTGFLKGDDVPRMFSMSDVYVMPSVSEPFGISPLEAMHSNVPVIISKQSGVAEILHHALKVDFWDVDAIADSIYGVLNYRSLANTFKKYGQSEVDNLKWENAALKVKQLYEKLSVN
ncbi:glycosyltransferase family 4 protein [Membranihabitans maritimus]|uniref:glycosyltransferase family 4 protein n=1 Tax=Membranihabitans maritimus TaxID=2904244 RepID=UPI001F2BD602|nr:glycosyltransferase family 4 protein [Membranihabitans maritimus]